MGKKRNFYFPPKQTKRVPKADGTLQISDDVKAELEKIAMNIADREIERRKAEDLNNYTAFTLEALSRLGWAGKTRLNRFLAMLTTVSEEATNADDSVAYADSIKSSMTAKGVVAFTENDDATPQLEDSGKGGTV